MNDAPKLGVLIEASLRHAWTHEAQSFTPWLAENLESLSAAIGIELELEGREVSVDAYSADILARNPADDSRVLIENQLERADHGHLGQILTYLAGLDAKTVVWIAAEFRDAHLSAVKWLNEHTAEPFAFFAVRVKVVRIGESPLAPVFEVLVRPNEWERRLQEVAQASRPQSEASRFRQDFWAHLLARHPDERQFGEAGATSSRWRYLEDLDLAIALYVGKEQVGIFVRGPRGADGHEIAARLEPHAERLVERTGAAFGSADRGHFFGRSRHGGALDRDNWDALVDWLHRTADDYEQALRETLGGDQR